VSEMLPERLAQIIGRLSQGNRSTALALHSLICAADETGAAVFNDVATCYREDHLDVVRAEGRDAQLEGGRLSLDEVRQHLAASVLPRLAAEGVIQLPQSGLTSPDARIRVTERVWAEIQPQRVRVADVLRHSGEHIAITTGAHPVVQAPAVGSVLEAQGLVKTYRRRRVVNDVALRLQQGEIVGLLGPNGAGKTTTFYMIVGLIKPQEGRILLDGRDITDMPMYQRARLGIGYLSQEPSIFRKLTVEQNILAILETMPLSGAERRARLERLLDELSIKHLRQSKAYALSGGERRRLEIRRALGTGPKSPDHLLEPGELRRRFDGFEVLFYEEVSAPEALARIAARRRT